MLRDDAVPHELKQNKGAIRNLEHSNAEEKKSNCQQTLKRAILIHFSAMKILIHAQAR